MRMARLQPLPLILNWHWPQEASTRRIFLAGSGLAGNCFSWPEAEEVDKIRKADIKTDFIIPENLNTDFNTHSLSFKANWR
jgi:hypothetical protein